MTKREAIKKHREMWRKLAISGLDTKPSMPGVLNNCFLCSYGESKGNIGLINDEFLEKICSICPLEWPKLNLETKHKATCEKSFFELWNTCEDEHGRKLIAIAIANLKEKK